MSGGHGNSKAPIWGAQSWTVPRGRTWNKAPESLPRRLRRSNWIAAQRLLSRDPKLGCNRPTAATSPTYWYSVENRSIVSAVLWKFQLPRLIIGRSCPARHFDHLERSRQHRSVIQIFAHFGQRASTIQRRFRDPFGLRAVPSQVSSLHYSTVSAQGRLRGNRRDVRLKAARKVARLRWSFTLSPCAGCERVPVGLSERTSSQLEQISGVHISNSLTMAST